jgi:hypothetical protein
MANRITGLEDILWQEASRMVSQIRSLAMAASSMDGGLPADPVDRENIKLDLLYLIEDLAGKVSHDLDGMECAVNDSCRRTKEAAGRVAPQAVAGNPL